MRRLGHRLRLEPPVADRAMLVRDRLLAQLRSRWYAPVTVVTAPAGYGKTTLLAQAVAANAAAPLGIDCWLGCSPDTDAASLLGEGLCRAVDAPPMAGGRGGIADVVEIVVEALWRRSPQQVALLLDDVHEIAAGSEAAQLLDAVVASLPANGHVVLAGRRPPPLPLARLEMEGRVVRIDQGDLAFTDDEVAAFAKLRATPGSKVAACGGWPALAELFASSTSDAVDDAGELAGDYVDQELLSHLPAARRRELGLLAHLGPVDDELARAILGDEADLSGLLHDYSVPLVTAAGGEWHVHSLWTSLAHDVTPDQVAEARRRAGVALLRRGRVGAAARHLLEAEAWDEMADAIVTALGVAHPPVAHDVLAGWLTRLPPAVRIQPVGRLLAAVLSAEGDPISTREAFEECSTEFRAQGRTAGELACLVQLAQMAWWTEDAERLAAYAAQAFELEAMGCEEVVPLCCLARGLMHDMANDSRQMLAELDRIMPGSLNDAWSGIVSWTRAIGLLELGLCPEALTAAEDALAHAELLHAPLAETSRLQALWYQGKTADVLDALPTALQRIKDSGYRNHTALIAAQCAVVHALQGLTDRAAGYLAQAQAAAAGVADAPLVDTNVSVAEAAVAVADGDEEAAAATLAAYVGRRPVREGIAAAPQQRHLALFYVLVPATRPVWDDADLGPAWAFGRGLARAVTAVRDGRGFPADTPSLANPAMVQAHLPPPWVAELGVAAVAAGREDGWQLLDATWSATRRPVTHMAQGSGSRLRRAARDVVARFPVPPTNRLRLRLLGPVDLRNDDGTLLLAPDWRRERVRSLLAYLALHGSVSRGLLAADLWSDLDVEAQSRNLRVTLTYLLRVLEPERGRRDPSFFVRQHGGNVALHPGEWLTVDVWDFDDHCEQARRLDRQGAPAAALDHAMQAVDLWRGEPAELASEPWALAALEQRRLTFATTATRAGELLLARGDTERTQALAEQALAVDPWLEAAHRLVVATHRARSDVVAARRALRRYREAIDELGLDPDDATRMVERLLDGLPAS